VTASLRSVVTLQRMRRGNVFVSTRRRSKACEGRVDVRRARVIFARASSVKSSTVRHKLDLGAVVAVCWKRDKSRSTFRPALRRAPPIVGQSESARATRR
jgi:hypothetical protein